MGTHWCLLLKMVSDSSCKNKHSLSITIRVLEFHVKNTGMDDPNKHHMPLEEALQDQKRINYHQNYLSNISAAIRSFSSSSPCRVKDTDFLE